MTTSKLRAILVCDMRYYVAYSIKNALSHRLYFVKTCSLTVSWQYFGRTCFFHIQPLSLNIEGGAFSKTMVNTCKSTRSHKLEVQIQGLECCISTAVIFFSLNKSTHNSEIPVIVNSFINFSDYDSVRIDEIRNFWIYIVMSPFTFKSRKLVLCKNLTLVWIMTNEVLLVYFLRLLWRNSYHNYGSIIGNSN